MGGQRKRRTGRRRWIVLLTLFGATATAAAAESPRAWFDIPEGSAEDTLSIFAAQSGLQVLFGYDDVRGIGTHAVSGWLDADAALRAMTLGTRLKLRFMDQDAVTFTVLPPSGQPRAPSLGTPETETESARGADISPIPHVTVLGTMSSPERAPSGEIITLTRQDIERTGLATLPEVIRTLPQVFGGGPTEDTEVGREAASNSGHGVGVNVRGLDAGSALVLVNGHRLPLGGSQGAFVDISQIPLIAIDKIRLMPGGASSRYGADDVAGLVNLVTRDARAEHETLARRGVATTRGYGETQLGQWLADAWHSGDAQLALEYYAHGALPAARSPQTQSDLTALGGTNWDTNLSNPGTLVAGGRSWALPRGQNGVALSPADLVPGENRSNRLEGADVMASQEHWSLFGSAHQQLTPHLKLYGDALASERTAQAHGAPFAAMLPVPPINPFYVNPSGTPGTVQVAYSFGRDFGPIDSSTRVNTLSAALNAEWRTGAWRLSGTASLASERQRQITRNLVNTAALLAALNDPDPTRAFNAMGDGSYTDPQTLERIRTSSQFNTNSRTLTATVLAERVIGNGAQLALGADHRQQAFDSVLLGHGASTDIAQDVGRHAAGAFAELTWPLLPERWRTQAAQHLDLLLSVRHDQFSDSGAATTPQVGLEWSPAPTWRVRINWRRSLRPPNLTDLLESNNVALVLPQQDPGNPAAFVPALVWSGNNARLRAERSRSWSFGVDLIPPAAPSASLALTYYAVVFHDRVTATPFSSTLLRDPALANRVTLDPTPAQRAEVCQHAIFFGSPGACLSTPIAGILDLRLWNAAALETRGVDAIGRYALASRIGAFDFTLNGNYIRRYAQASMPGDAFADLRNTPSHPPRLRWRASASWEPPHWSATVFVNYTNRYRDPYSVPVRAVASSTTVDVHVEHRFADASQPRRAQTALALTLRNVLDRAPPFLNNPIGIGYDQENADPVGRSASLTIRQTW